MEIIKKGWKLKGKICSQQRRTQNFVKHPRWSIFVKIVNGFKPVHYIHKRAPS